LHEADSVAKMNTPKCRITLDKNKGGLNIPTVDDICLASIV